MDPRINFFESLINNKTDRILELGPLNRPIADKEHYPNSFTCDIRSTDEVIALYSGNDYLKATGITIDPRTIVPIDYVARESYTKALEGIERFDYVIASHVLEHVEDLIFSLQDIGNLLKPGGVFCIVYPDKRYCFDHFRTSASFRDAYRVFRGGARENSDMVLDFFYSVVPENNPTVFWSNEDLIRKHIPKSDFQDALDHYEQAIDGVKMDDVHYWPFTDMDFLKFLYDCTRAHLLPFRCIAFRPCLKNDQQFMLALEYDPTVLEHSENAELLLTSWMEKALPDFYTSKSADQLEDNLRLTTELSQCHKQLAEMSAKHGDEIMGLQAQLANMSTEYRDEIMGLQAQLAEMSAKHRDERLRLQSELDNVSWKYQDISTSTTWRMTAPVRKLLDWIKSISCRTTK